MIEITLLAGSCQHGCFLRRSVDAGGNVDTKFNPMLGFGRIVLRGTILVLPGDEEIVLRGTICRNLDEFQLFHVEQNYVNGDLSVLNGENFGLNGDFRSLAQEDGPVCTFWEGLEWAPCQIGKRVCGLVGLGLDRWGVFGGGHDG